MIATITKAYIRKYTDNGQTKAYVEWIDNHGQAGRTEGNVGPCECCGRGGENYMGAHMKTLFARAKRDGVTITYEAW